MSYMMQPRVVILKEGTDSSQGKGQLISNINACEAVVTILKTTLGPRGMDKLIHDPRRGNKVTISNDGATIVNLLDIVHPAAKTMVDISRSQDDEVGDGTTSVCLVASELLRQVKGFIEEDMHPQVIIKGYRMACREALRIVNEISVKIDEKDEKSKKEVLVRCAGTAMNSKLICGQKDYFSNIVVDAVMSLDEDLDLSMIGIKKIPGGSTTDSFLVEGVAFKKTFAYAGFEQQPKCFDNPKIAILNVELELKSERQNAEIRISNPAQYQSIVDAEWKIIYDKLDKIVDSGAKIVLSKLPIGDLATQYFADREMFCAGRVQHADLNRIAKATGGVVQTSLEDLCDDVLGTCVRFEEQQIGPERYNFFTGCPKRKACTLVLRGGSEQYIAESERSLHDAIMIVKRTMTSTAVIGGGGAIEMELSNKLIEYSNTIKSRLQLVVGAFAKALEVIPRQLAENAGFDTTDLLNSLRAAHVKGDTWAGIDINKGCVGDMIDLFVWEPAMMKLNVLSAATEAACIILSVDETIKNPKLNNPVENNRPVPTARGRGMRR